MTPENNLIRTTTVELVKMIFSVLSGRIKTNLSVVIVGLVWSGISYAESGEHTMKWSEKKYLQAVNEEFEFRQYALEVFRRTKQWEKDPVRKKGYELLVRLEETHEARVSEFRQSMGVDTDMRFVNRMRTTPTAVALKLIPETTLSIIKSAAISFVNMLQEIVDNGPEEHIGIHQWFVEQESILLEYISLYLDGQDEAAIKVLQDELSRRD